MKLTEHQQKVKDAFHPEDKDLDIAVLYTRVYGDPGTKTLRQMQQSLAPNIDTLNFKMEEIKKVIRLGDIKRTYRLTNV